MIRNSKKLITPWWTSRVGSHGGLPRQKFQRGNHADFSHGFAKISIRFGANPRLACPVRNPHQELTGAFLDFYDADLKLIDKWNRREKVESDYDSASKISCVNPPLGYIYIHAAICCRNFCDWKSIPYMWKEWGLLHVRGFLQALWMGQSQISATNLLRVNIPLWYFAGLCHSCAV